MSEDDAAEEDDDWFEQALEGEPAEAPAVADDGTDATEPSPASAATEEADPSDDGDSLDGAEPSDDLDEADSGDAVDEPLEADSFDGDDATEPTEAELESAFADAAATAEVDEPDADASVGMDADAGDAFGMDDGDEGLFEDDFASAFGAAGGDDERFDDADFDSAIPRLDLGIEGLDRMIRGGVPERHLMVAIGSAGSGKTTFGLQFLNHGLENGENVVFITLEQSHEAIMDTADEYGWDFGRHEDEGRLAVIDLDPIEMANSLDNIRGELPALVADFDANRLVLDSVSLLEMMYDDQARRRTEIYDFTRSLKSAGVTTLLTSEADEDNAYASRHGIIEYLTDAVFVLQYVRSESRETRLAVEIQKIRNANHSRETKPYEITDEGISVYQQANIF